MGGSVCIGIRRSDGREQLSDQFTNSIPFWSTDPRFMDEGAPVDEMMALYAKHNRVFSHLDFSEYGVVLVDFMTKKVISRQPYCHIGRFHAGFHCGEDTYAPASAAVQVLAMQEAGRLLIKNVGDNRSGENVSQRIHNAIIETLRTHKNGHLPSRQTLRFDAHLDWRPWEIDDGLKCDAKAKAEIRAFMKTNGWATPRYKPRKPKAA